MPPLLNDIDAVVLDTFTMRGAVDFLSRAAWSGSWSPRRPAQRATKVDLAKMPPKLWFQWLKVEAAFISTKGPEALEQWFAELRQRPMVVKPADES